MDQTKKLLDANTFSQKLFEVMKQIHPGIEEMELYEFRYALNNFFPSEGGWESIHILHPEEIQAMVSDFNFFESIKIKPIKDGCIILDHNILNLTQTLFTGLVTGVYSVEWVNKIFSFDLRGFYFQVRSRYFTEKIKNHFGGKPYRQFERKQQIFDREQSIGYKDFKQANLEVDEFFMDCIERWINVKGTPILMAIAGPTAAGKTEIVERLESRFVSKSQKVTTIEMDNFLTDRDYREAHGINTRGPQAIHYDRLKQGLIDITKGKRIEIPRYDFVYATSSHDIQGNLKPDGKPICVEPADIIFIEGNFPFLLPELAPLITIKVVYLTDDPIRMKRKWRRDIDYRKKYDPNYFRNRFFKEQFLMAEHTYRPQMELCDILVDTTGAAIWMTNEAANIISE